MKVFSIATFCVATLLLFSCQKKENLQVKHASNMELKQKLNVKVINAEDPICHMKTDNFIQDTMTYNGQVYGFCSTYCKDEFKANPSKFIK